MAAADIDVAYVAKLARLELTPDEIVRFGEQLGTLLDHVARLETLPTADIAATAQVIPLTDIARADVPRPSLARDAFLAMAPSTEGAYIRVPRILGEDG